MSGWHIDDDLAGRYAAGLADQVLAASIEAHVMSCPACRERLAETVPAERLSHVWEQVIMQVDAEVPVMQRILVRLGWSSRLSALGKVIRTWSSRLPRPSGRGAKRPLRARLAFLAGAAFLVGVTALSFSATIGPGPDGRGRPDVATGAARANLVGGAAQSEPATALTGPPPGQGAGAQGMALAQRLNDLDGRNVPSGEPPDRVVLNEGTAEALGIGTALIGHELLAGRQQKVVPRAAVVYGHVGAWVYTSRESRLLIRKKITVDHIQGDVVVLAYGPPVGTSIVTFTV
jgi:hypothetical protein